MTKKRKPEDSEILNPATLVHPPAWLRRLS